MSTITELAKYYGLSRFPRFSISGKKHAGARYDGDDFVVADADRYIVIALAPHGSQAHVSGREVLMTHVQARALRDGLTRLLGEEASDAEA